MTDQQLNSYELMYLSESISKAAEAIHVDKDRAVVFAIKAKDNLDKFISLCRPQPEFTDEEANLSSYLHTCLRKYCDGPLSVILYNLVSDNKGMTAWNLFVKGVLKYKDDGDDRAGSAFWYMKEELDYNVDTDTTLMKCAIELWDYKEVNDLLKELA